MQLMNDQPPSSANFSESETNQEGWDWICEKLSWPKLNEGLENFKHESPLGQRSMAAYWTDVHATDPELRIPAQSGTPSDYAINWAARKGITEHELRVCHAELVELFRDDPPSIADKAN